MTILENTVLQLDRAESKDAAFHAFCSAMQRLGYDKISYTLCTDHPSLGLPKQHGLSTSYPEDWMKEYVDKKYLKVDPVVKELISNPTPFFWDSVIDKQDKGSAPHQLMHDAEDAGVADGIGISFKTPYQEVTGIGIARNDRIKGPKDYDLLAKIHFLTVYFHETYRELITKPDPAELTFKEIEVLSWAAEGKSDADIADLMNISFHTVRFHWKNIFEKLDVFNKIHAVSKALRLRLIQPGMITY